MALPRTPAGNGAAGGPACGPRPCRTRSLRRVRAVVTTTVRYLKRHVGHVGDAAVLAEVADQVGAPLGRADGIRAVEVHGPVVLDEIADHEDVIGPVPSGLW